ncbi:pilus assembly protein TadG [Bradyrhizobium sacchari]|uniref:Putative Flp pilus-assembly TadE/G-like protein n=1 Tax=Bradyrhizobium sacchari TaxID=1399419 RepID=A0A560JQA4_9BRAD|nr:pilus assembly protein TadG-related protein [Bradyrhizobium sacchari]OPY98168.1 pilus assembly protein TadG [Bradyrhizobium sacchari]TWB58841.1 putative Flp pilus-assembly TadE/G-like protein [Bradyrhizobium sacchari]TWB72799.1 putative Flp pilus-assembly TadE/G-like protein [Bradyrhizobium sacchari]
MRNLLRTQRGSAAFATAIALVPLIGAVALGAEAGSWYVTRKHAQNAADSGAYSGALRLACTIAGASCDAQSVDYRGKEFAAQNGFCNSSPKDSTPYPDTQCPSSLPTRVSRAVQIDIGTYSSGTFTTPPPGSSTGNAVRARVSQQQPAYLSAVLGLTTVNIPAQAIALVQLPSKVCALALGPNPNSGGGALKISGSSSSNGTGCPIMSDDSVQFASTPSFTGSGWAVFGATGCSPTNTCANPGVTHNYFMPPAINPLQGLDAASFNTRTSPSTKPCGGNVTNGQTCSLNPNSASGVYSDLKVNAGGTVNFAAGTYFFYNATISFGGTVSGTGVTLVLLGTSSLTINGGNVNLSAPTTNAFSSALNGVLIDDQSRATVSIGGNGVIKLAGAMYFPKADVSFGGSTQPSNTTCSSVIAKTLNLSGGAYLSTDGCAPNVIAFTQVVSLVQ